MQGIVDVELIGLTELQAKLGAITPATQDRLRPFMAQATINLREAVKANIADRFKSTGPLYQSVQSEVSEEPGVIEGRVFTEGVPYAAIQEYGGTTPPHVITPVRAKVLAFMSGGGGFSSGGGMSEMIFTKRVNHPGSRIPERSYARTALADYRVPFTDGIRGVVSGALGDAGFRMAAE